MHAWEDWHWRPGWMTWHGMELCFTVPRYGDTLLAILLAVRRVGVAGVRHLGNAVTKR